MRIAGKDQKSNTPVEVESFVGISGLVVVVSHAGKLLEEVAEVAGDGLPLAGLAFYRPDIAADRRNSSHPLVNVVGKHHGAWGIVPVVHGGGERWRLGMVLVPPLLGGEPLSD